MSNSSATLVKPQQTGTGITSGARPPLWAKSIRTAFWTAVGIVGALALTEGLFAIAHIGEEEFVDIHPNIGFWHMPNKMVTWRSEGFSQSTTSNDGLRDINFPIPKPAGVKRIAVTGDSMVEGYQVGTDQTFVKVLADRLSKDGIKTEGMNFGMSGFSTVQALYLFKEKIQKYHPDIMILAYHVGDNEKNAYAASTGGFMPRPHALLKDGKLQTDWRGYDIWWNGQMHKEYDSTRWLRANSRIWGVLTKLELQMADIKWYTNLKKKLAAKPAKQETTPERFTSTTADFGLPDTTFDTSYAKLPEPHWLYLPMSDKLNKAQAKEVAADRDISAGWRSIVRNNSERFAMTGSVIDTLNRACKQANCKLVVAALPAPSNSLLYKREMLMMENLAKQAQFTFVDLNAEFPKIAPMQQNDYYFNVHFTPRGHELVTDLLQNHFKSAGLVDYLRTGP
jgi:hypothetical protein